MIITNANWKEKITLSNKNNKLSRDRKVKKIIKLKNGLYETDANVPGYLLAGSIYGPSYLSFEFALSYYGLIPEKVTNYTCATFEKKKKKKFKNHFGTYLYRDVPSEVYPIAIKSIVDGNYSYQIASPEKALCDKLYTLKPLQNINNLKQMLFEDLRMEKDMIEQLNVEIINGLANHYHSTNVNLLLKYMRSIEDESNNRTNA